MSEIPATSAVAPVSFCLYSADFDAFAAALGASFERWGFAVVSDHGLDDARITTALEAAKRFFALPEAVKLRYRIRGAAGQRGYTPFGVETAKGAADFDLKEFWHVGRESCAEAGGLANVWPAEVSGFREATLWLYEALEGLGDALLEAIARRLGLERRFFAPTTHLGDSVLRLLHYPPAGFEGPNLRAAPHEDINTITLLLGAEEGGLQIRGRDGAWTPINPPPGAVVCNIGDMLQRLTNHVLPSTTHRVVNPTPKRRGAARYSTPFFLHFAPDYVIETLPSCVGPGRPNRYPTPITARGYLQERLREIRLL